MTNNHTNHTDQGAHWGALDLKKAVAILDRHETIGLGIRREGW